MKSCLPESFPVYVSQNGSPPPPSQRDLTSPDKWKKKKNHFKTTDPLRIAAAGSSSSKWHFYSCFSFSQRLSQVSGISLCARVCMYVCVCVCDLWSLCSVPQINTGKVIRFQMLICHLICHFMYHFPSIHLFKGIQRQSTWQSYHCSFLYLFSVLFLLSFSPLTFMRLSHLSAGEVLCRSSGTSGFAHCVNSLSHCLSNWWMTVSQI